MRILVARIKYFPVEMAYKEVNTGDYHQEEGL